MRMPGTSEGRIFFLHALPVVATLCIVRVGRRPTGVQSSEFRPTRPDRHCGGALGLHKCVESMPSLQPRRPLQNVVSVRQGDFDGPISPKRYPRLPSLTLLGPQRGGFLNALNTNNVKRRHARSTRPPRHREGGWQRSTFNVQLSSTARPPIAPSRIFRGRDLRSVNGLGLGKRRVGGPKPHTQTSRP